MGMGMQAISTLTDQWRSPITTEPYKRTAKETEGGLLVGVVSVKFSVNKTRDS